MILKILIFILMLAMIVSLFTGLRFLFTDNEVQGSRRTWYALGIRVSLAACIVILVAWGISTGELDLSTPWHRP